MSSLFKILPFRDPRLIDARNRSIKYKSFRRIDIEKYQLQKFNRIWMKSLATIPFYKNWQINNSLPIQLCSLSELNQFPIISKYDVQVIYAELNRYKKFKDTIKTGGSTGNILELPASNDLRNSRASSMMLARYLMGIEFPNTDYLMLWGHAHLMGNGIIRLRNLMLRRIKDLLLGINRKNAYNMTNKKAYEFIKEINKGCWNYSVTYSSVGSLLIKAGLLDTRYPHKLILTGDSVDFNIVRSIDNSENLSVNIEYGSAETGLISFTKDKTYNHYVVWDRVIAQSQSKGNLIITSIDEYEDMPLIRYNIEDVIDINQSDNQSSILNFNKIIGRSNDLLELTSANGQLIQIYPEVWQHIFRKINWITQFCVEQVSCGEIDIQYVGEDYPNGADVLIKNYLTQAMQCQIAVSFNLKRVDFLQQSISGKHRFVVKNYQ